MLRLRRFKTLCMVLCKNIYMYMWYIYSIYQFDTVLQTDACIHYMYIIKFSFYRYSLKYIKCISRKE